MERKPWHSPGSCFKLAGRYGGLGPAPSCPWSTHPHMLFTCGKATPQPTETKEPSPTYPARSQSPAAELGGHHSPPSSLMSLEEALWPQELGMGP